MSSGGSATERLHEPPADATGELEMDRRDRAISKASTVVAGVRRAASTGGWPQLIEAAAVAFLALCCVGAVLVVAAKLQFPDFGSGSSPLSVLIAIVMVSLAVLGAPLETGDLDLSAIPVGALVAAGAAISWATSGALRDRDLGPHPAREGARVGLPFALACGAAALVFRFRGDGGVNIDAVAATLWGALWGAAFGALGGLRTKATYRALAGRAWDRLARGAGALDQALRTAGVMLAATLVLSAAAGLLWVIGSLLGGTPQGATRGGGGLDAGRIAATFIYLVAFLPNAVMAVATLAMAAPLEVGARVTIAGRAVGPLERYSIWGWAGEGAPWFAFAFLLVPLAACALGGYWAHRTSSERDPRRALGTAAVLFAIVVTVLGWLAEARLGGGLLTGRGFGRVAPVELLLFGAAFLWAAGAGALGWWWSGRSGPHRVEEAA